MFREMQGQREGWVRIGTFETQATGPRELALRKPERVKRESDGIRDGRSKLYRHSVCQLALLFMLPFIRSAQVRAYDDRA